MSVCDLAELEQQLADLAQECLRIKVCYDNRIFGYFDQNLKRGGPSGVSICKFCGSFKE